MTKTLFVTSSYFPTGLIFNFFVRVLYGVNARKEKICTLRLHSFVSLSSKLMENILLKIQTLGSAKSLNIAFLTRKFKVILF